MDQNKYQISILLNHVCVYTTVVGTRILFLQMSTPKLSIKRTGYILAYTCTAQQDAFQGRRQCTYDLGV